MATAWDGRASAWAGVWTRVQHMTKMREAVRERASRYSEADDQMPAEFWAVRAEAELLVGLLNADVNTGIIAGAWLEEEARMEAERQESERIFRAGMTEKIQGFRETFGDEKKDGSNE